MNKDGTPSDGEEIVRYGPGLMTVTRLTKERARARGKPVATFSLVLAIVGTILGFFGMVLGLVNLFASLKP